MATINMKKLVVSESDAMDPYSEYVYESDVERSEPVPVIPQKALRPKQELFDNIDKLFDGADFVFDIANKIRQRLGGR